MFRADAFNAVDAPSFADGQCSVDRAVGDLAYCCASRVLLGWAHMG